MRKTLGLLTPLLYMLALFSVVATAKMPGYESFLHTMTQENGVFETISVLLLLSIFFYGLVSVYNYRKNFNKRALFLIVSFAIVALLAAMEEISWGQHLFHFQSSSYFLENNMQHETNLHNFMNANLFSSIIYSSVYTFLVFIPLLYKLVLKRYKRFAWLDFADINAHTILMVLFASSFQIYFYDNFGVIFDMVTLLGALALFGYFLYSKQSSSLLKIHFIFILGASVLFMVHYEVFDFFNMQYEIREMFIVLASLLIYIELIQKYHVK